MRVGTAVAVCVLSMLASAGPASASDRFRSDREYFELYAGVGGAAGITPLHGPLAGGLANVGFGLNFGPWVGMTAGLWGIAMWEVPELDGWGGTGGHVDIELMQGRPEAVDLYGIVGGSASAQASGTHDGLLTLAVRVGGGADVFVFEQDHGEWVLGARAVLMLGSATGGDGHIPTIPVRADVFVDLHAKWHFRIF